MAKMDKKWVVLCSTAVAAVYASGYFTTESQAANLMPHHQTQLNVTASNSSPYSRHSRHHHSDDESSGGDQWTNNQTNNQTNNTTGSVSNKQSNTQSSSQSVGKFKDGTYKGTAENRRGFIEVTVTIKSDKISDVEISNWGMHYDESDVDGLPQVVVQNQSAQVQNVSGATYSTEAFKGAVQDALTKAKNA